MITGAMKTKQFLERLDKEAVMNSGKKQLLGSMFYGRSAQSTIVDTRTNFSPQPPAQWYTNVYGPGASNKNNTDVKENTPDQEEVINPVQVDSVDYCVSQNTADHHTNEYEITHPGRDRAPQLVIRRGQPFEVSLKLNRPYDPELDQLKVVMEIGDTAKHSKGTQQTLMCGSDLKAMLWSACVSRTQEKTITLRIQPACDAIIGKWKFMIETTVKVDESDDDSEIQRMIYRYEHDEPIYVLFNAFCKQDQVYIEDDYWRDECVMNDTGKIYTGTSLQIGHRPWSFAQFDDCVLDCALLLRDMAKIRDRARASPVTIARVISQMINSSDDNGIMIGNWSGSYEDGVSPMCWIGSLEILKQFYETRKPVKFGQCYVFAGVAATVCRTLGLPCRLVTNYSSAHDCHANLTVDIHWDNKGAAILPLNTDAVWNFHVWNEVWMTRPDIPGSYGGWQIIDCTPQDTSDGIYCAGPMPVTAIKEGNLHLGFDGHLIFAEVNADKVHWYQTNCNEWRRVTERAKIGKMISTKQPRNTPKDQDDDDAWRRHIYHSQLWYDDPERLDVTNTYKHPTGTEDERAAIMKANAVSTKPNVYDKGKEDVSFKWNNKDNVLVGANFDIVLKLQNTSREERTVSGIVTLRSCFYTGIPKSHVKKVEFKRVLGSIKLDDVILRVTAEEYGHLMTDQYAFILECVSWVKETNQLFTCNDQYRLRRPDLKIQTAKKCKIGEELDCTVKLTNSMGVALTRCSWRLEGPGILKPVRIEHGTIEPFDNAEIKLKITPIKVGKRTLLASFDSKELTDVTGETTIQVSES